MRKCTRPSFWSFFGWTKQKLSSTTTSKTSDDSLQKALVENDDVYLSSPSAISKKPGWKAVPYILGNEAIERLATFGLTANMMVYLMREFEMEQVEAANILNVWNGASNVFPLIGAFFADAYLGKFLTIILASFAALLGMAIITLTASIPQLRPPKCSPTMEQLDQCIGYTKSQVSVLLIGLYWLALGTGGIRPCTIPFGIDQFDTTSVEGRKATNSLYNWFYTIFTLTLLIAQTVIVYIQDSISWAFGFGLPTFLMFCSIILFLAGSKFYVYEKPEGSLLSRTLQVFVAAYKKRHHKVSIEAKFFDPPHKENEVAKLPLSTRLRFFNKAALIVDNNDQYLKLDDEPCPNPWRLCSIQQVEEVKCLIKIFPIWSSGIICFISMTTQGTFTVSQAMKMDLHLRPKFQIPPGSVCVISYITIAIWLPLYDSVILPTIRKITKHEKGISTLQRIAIGNVCSILYMVVAGLVEGNRRAIAISNPRPSSVPQMSVMWLAPQLILLGFCEIFSVVGHIEFYNDEFPYSMRSIGNSLLFLSIAGANYLSSLLVDIVHRTSAKDGQPDWLTDDINEGRLEYFYFLIAGLGALNFIYLLFCSNGYCYKTTVKVDIEQCNIGGDQA
ncbi:hypothetical protein FEM48_Zijuj10G0071400 [Ziziphus jujuba var. spinosa]|uniref:Protein NRT1/ PTR FAMILY 2.13-like n=1 Tax=Ziziphus jujuba var. spinosa TaxID=714518 RepID=A0A978UM09_ZIZJJ|nr:hypothetical protein FEM48_Zijuj10G0071400 [Ziziphus jujuba var. spinosa]